jgi:hypothetical protein
VSIDFSKTQPRDLENAIMSESSDALARELQRLKGARTYVSLASEIGVKEGILRAYLTGRAGAGLDTLSTIIAWDLIDARAVEHCQHLPTLTTLVIAKMIDRGLRVRDTSISEESAA